MSQELEKAEKRPIEVAVAIPERTVTEKEFQLAMTRAGAVDISEKQARDLESIGLHVKGAGSHMIQRGRVFVNQHRAEAIMQALHGLLNETMENKKDRQRVAKVTKIAETIGGLMDRQIRAGQLAVEIEQHAAPVGRGRGAEERPPEVVPFAAGKPIVPQGGTLVVAQQVTMNAPNSQNGGQGAAKG